MTTSSTPTGNDDDDATSSDRFERDYVLQCLQAFANSSADPASRGAGLTLFVDGRTVAGYLMPNWAWFEHEAQRVSDVSTSDAGAEGSDDSMASYWSGVADVMRKRDPQERRRIAFLHLTDIRVIRADGTDTFAGVNMRVRISSVAGFFIGVPN